MQDKKGKITFLWGVRQIVSQYLFNIHNSFPYCNDMDFISL